MLNYYHQSPRSILVSILGPLAASPPSYVPSSCYSLLSSGWIHQSPHYHCYPRAASLPGPSSSPQFLSAITALLLLSSGCLFASAVVSAQLSIYRQHPPLLLLSHPSHRRHLGSPTATLVSSALVAFLLLLLALPSMISIHL